MNIGRDRVENEKIHAKSEIMEQVCQFQGRRDLTPVEFQNVCLVIVIFFSNNIFNNGNVISSCL